MKEKIIKSLSLTKEEVENFEEIFTVDFIKLQKYEDRSRENYYEKFGLKDHIIFFYATDKPEQDFNVLSFNDKNELELINLQKVVDIVDQLEEIDLNIVCHCLQYVLKPTTMTKIVLNLETRDKQKMRAIVSKKQ